jgi:hypothetical protein
MGFKGSLSDNIKTTIKTQYFFYFKWTIYSKKLYLLNSKFIEIFWSYEMWCIIRLQVFLFS